MATHSHIYTLFTYHWHTTQRLMTSAARLSASEYMQSPGYGHGSIHELLFHLLRTDQGWRLALETGRQFAPIRQEDYPDLRSLQAGFAGEQSAWEVLLSRMSPEQIASTIDLTNWRGDTVTFSMWRILHHLVLHGMQHHTEIAQLLTIKGQSPGDIDFIFFD